MLAETAGPCNRGLATPSGLASGPREHTLGLGSEEDTDHWRWTGSSHRGAAADMVALVRTGRGGGAGGTLGWARDRRGGHREETNSLWKFGGGPKGGISQKQILIQHKEEAH